jgi:hypothetical protein
MLHYQRSLLYCFSSCLNLKRFVKDPASVAVVKCGTRAEADVVARVDVRKPAQRNACQAELWNQRHARIDFFHKSQPEDVVDFRAEDMCVTELVLSGVRGGFVT